MVFGGLIPIDGRFGWPARGVFWSLWDYFGITLELLGALRGHFGISLGSLDHCGVTLVPLWGHFGVTLDHLGIILASL